LTEREIGNGERLRDWLVGARCANGVAGATDRDLVDVVTDGERPEMVDHESAPTGVQPCAMRDGSYTPANADRRRWCANGRLARVTDLPPDESKHAFGQRSGETAGSCARVIDELVYHDFAIAADVQCRAVGEGDLERSF
jgi:hypothetical protein